MATAIEMVIGLYADRRRASWGGNYLVSEVDKFNVKFRGRGSKDLTLKKWERGVHLGQRMARLLRGSAICISVPI